MNFLHHLQFFLTFAVPGHLALRTAHTFASVRIPVHAKATDWTFFLLSFRLKKCNSNG